MTRALYDSTTAADIPKHADMVAGYVDGRYKTVPALLDRFPKATIVTITVLGSPGAHVCDTEPGNIGIDGAARWAAREVKEGRHPTLYCMASQWPQVKAAVAKHGATGKVSYWIAQYDGKAVIPAGAVAKQHLHGDKSNPGSYSGGHYDVSVVADYWPGVDPDLTPKPPVVHPPAKATPLAPMTRAALVYVTRRLKARRHAVRRDDRPLLTKVQLAAQSALGIKEDKP